MFEDNGDVSITKSKSFLKNQLHVEVSDCKRLLPDAVIIESCVCCAT